MTRQFCTVFLLFVFCFLQGVQAQQTSQDFIGVNQGDLYVWRAGDSSAQQLTSWGYNGGPVLSPDGQWIAYLSLPNVIATPDFDPAYQQETPYNIWIMNTDTRSFTRIAGDDGNTNVARGVPVWSPDSNQLLWVEKQRGQNTAQWITYNRQSNTTQVVNTSFEVREQNGFATLPTLQWSSQGVSRIRSAEDGRSILEVYRTLSTAVLPETLVLSEVPATAPIDHIWVYHEGNEQIAVIDLQGNWTVVDPTVMTSAPLSNQPELIIKNNPDAIAIIPRFTGTSTGRIFSWSVTMGTAEYDLNYSSNALTLDGLPAISYDGLAVAWTSFPALGETALYTQTIGNDSAQVIQSGARVIGSPRPTTVVGAPTYWTTGANRPTSTTCLLPTRLKIGDTITIIPGPPNRVRANAGLDAPVIASFSSGDTANILDGPRCVDNIQWWYVSNTNFSGWTAEGQNGEYWLQD